MRADRRLSVEAWDRADAVKLATGALQTVDNQIDTATGTIKLRATFENADESLFPNQFVNIRLRVRTLQNATTIPAAAVQRAAFGEFVYVVKPGQEPTVSIQRVTLGPTEGERVAVTNGLAPQAQVVLEGVDQLTEGAKVEIVPEGGAPAGPPTGRRRGPGGQGAGPGGRGPGGQGAPGGGQAPGAAPSQGAPAPGRTGPGGDTGSGRRAAAALMNLSRPFILRPVATALLMAALLLSGILAVPAAAGLGAAAGRLPDDPHHHLLSGRQPGGDDELGDGAARAAVRSAAGPGADVVDELGRRLGDHAALRAREAARASPSRKCRRR